MPRKLKMQDTVKKLSDSTEMLEKQAQTEDIDVLVDVGYNLNEIKKTCETLLNDIKTKVKGHAEENKVKQINGYSGRTMAKISQSSSTNIDPVGALSVLKKLDKLSMFETVFKVNVTDFKKYFGEPPKDIAEVTVVEYGSISFKEKKR